MGIKKKIQWQFYFYFCCRKGQIQRHYSGKNFSTWKLLSHYDEHAENINYSYHMQAK